METKILAQRKKTFPTVIFKEGILNIVGRSISLNHNEWWKTLLSNVINLTQNKNLKEIHLSLEYINSDSNRWIINLLRIIDQCNSANQDIKILWHCHITDEVMLEHISVFSSIIETPIEIIFE